MWVLKSLNGIWAVSLCCLLDMICGVKFIHLHVQSLTSQTNFIKESHRLPIIQGLKSSFKAY